MSKHNQKPGLISKLGTKLNPLDPKNIGKGIAVDAIAAGGRPTAGLSLPVLGPSIQANSDEAMADALRDRLPEGWRVGQPHHYRQYINDALKQGHDGEQALEFAKSKMLRDLGHKDYLLWKDPNEPIKGPPLEDYPEKFPAALPPPISPTPKGPEKFPVALPAKPGETEAGSSAPAASPATDPDRTPSPPPERQGMAPEQTGAAPSLDTSSLGAKARAPITDPGRAAILKPVEKWTEEEMKHVIDTAQSGFRGWRSGDPLKDHMYERVQDWHVSVYGDEPQQNDGGKPVDAKPVRTIPQVASPYTTPDGEDLWQATGRLGEKVAQAATEDGTDRAVASLQRGLNILNASTGLPPRSKAYPPYTKLGPVDEDGQYGPQTDFALKHATARLGAAKVEEAFALGRFNTFARNAQKGGNPEGLEAATHTAFGPLIRDPKDAKAPKVEAGVLQETLNDLGAQTFDDWENLKVDDWIGPKTTAAFGRVLKHEDPDRLTQVFGRGLGLL